MVDRSTSRWAGTRLGPRLRTRALGGVGRVALAGAFGLQGGVLFFEQGVRLLQEGVLVLERAAAHAFSVQVEREVLEAAVGVGEAVLQDPFEAGFGVGLLATAALGVVGAAIVEVDAVLDEQAHQGQGGGDRGAAAERAPERITVHGEQASLLSIVSASSSIVLLSIVGDATTRVQYPEHR